MGCAPEVCYLGVQYEVHATPYESRLRTAQEMARRDAEEERRGAERLDPSTQILRAYKTGTYPGAVAAAVVEQREQRTTWHEVVLFFPPPFISSSDCLKRPPLRGGELKAALPMQP